VWNTAAGNYASYIAGVGVNGGSNIIAAGQAFMVRTNNVSPVLIARENVKSTSNGTFLRSSTDSRLLAFKLTKEGSIASDENVIRIVDGATEEFDPMFDAYKLSGAELNLAMLTNSNMLSIHSLAEVNDQTVIPLRVKSSQPGSFALSFGKVSEFIPNGRMWLKDNFTFMLTPIEDETTVAFQITNDVYSQEDGRFELVFSQDNITWNSRPLVEKTTLSVYPNPTEGGKFTLVTNKPESSTTVSILDLSGKLIYTEVLDWQQKVEMLIDAKLAPGLYVVKVQMAEKTFTQKLINN